MVTKFTSRLLALIVCLMVLEHLSPAAEAALIANLNNTGTSGGVALVGAGVADPNYSLIVQPGSSTAVTVDHTIWPIFGGPWVPNNGFSRWIGPDQSSQGPVGNYTYRTTFTVPANANLSTVNVSGLWGTDDPSVDIYINGNSTGNVSAGFMSLVPFSVTNNFVFGLNTLDFALFNAGGPTGLRVDRIVGTYRIPEPASVCLVGVVLVAAAGVVRRIRVRMPMP